MQRASAEKTAVITRDRLLHPHLTDFSCAENQQCYILHYNYQSAACAGPILQTGTCDRQADHGRIVMGDRGKGDKGTKETKKKPKLNPKEKRKQKRDKKNK